MSDRVKTRGRTVCDICLDNHNLPGDRLAVCVTCLTTVHQACYGGDILEGLPPGSWRCERCRYQGMHPREEIKCVFCPQHSRGAFKRLSIVGSNEYVWAHVQCVNWMPEIYFASEE